MQLHMGLTRWYLDRENPDSIHRVRNILLASLEDVEGTADFLMSQEAYFLYVTSFGLNYGIWKENNHDSIQGVRNILLASLEDTKETVDFLIS